MKKKLLAMVLAAALMIGTLPATVLAAGESELPKLPTPTNLEWGKSYWYEDEVVVLETPGSMSWKFPEIADSDTCFVVSLYNESGEKIETIESSFFGFEDKYDLMQYFDESFNMGDPESGIYYFTVQATSTDGTYMDSDIATSDTWTYTRPEQKLPTPTGLTWDGSTLCWEKIDVPTDAWYDVCFYFSKTEDGEFSSCGSVQVRENKAAFGKVVEWWESDGLTWGWIAQTKGIGYYRCDVTAISKDITQYLHSARSELSATFYYDGGTGEPPAPQPTELTKSMFTVDTSAVTHTGSPITKTITSDLTLDTDYTVTYTNNTAVGTAKITITGIGDYTGTLEYTFTIKAKSTSTGGSSSGGSSSKPSTPSKPTEPTTPVEPETPVEAETPVEPETPVVPASEKFTDVVKGSWYEDGVTYVTNKGLFQGTSEGVFAPQNNMTRAMLMTVLARLDGQDTEGGETWYSKAMDWAKEQGVSDGAQPSANVTREQLVVMLYRYAGEPEGQSYLNVFTDGGNVSAWAQTAMEWAVANGILTGKDGQRLDPQGTATRGEVAAVIQRFVEKIEEK